MTSREFHWNIGGQDITVRIEESQGHGTFQVAGGSLPFRLLEPNRIEIDGKAYRFYVVRAGNEYTVWLNGHTYHFSRIEKGGLRQTAIIPSGGEIRALMPGKILRIEVGLGDLVEARQTAVIMESMKMESALRAPRAGRISRIYCQPGQVVEMGEILIVVD